MRAAGGVSGGVGNRRAESIRIDPRGGRANGVCRIWSRRLGGPASASIPICGRKLGVAVRDHLQLLPKYLPIECKETALQSTCLSKRTTW
jgi:hypothetical protein